MPPSGSRSASDRWPPSPCPPRRPWRSPRAPPTPSTRWSSRACPSRRPCCRRPDRWNRSWATTAASSTRRDPCRW
ncbi:MAG: hypothetical protein FJ396_08875 [Verrucomicrobia bacterium]|nr:hypothetical protein [Verrucomicrobiota bacterium]